MVDFAGRIARDIDFAIAQTEGNVLGGFQIRRQLRYQRRGQFGDIVKVQRLFLLDVALSDDLRDDLGQRSDLSLTLCLVAALEVIEQAVEQEVAAVEGFDRLNDELVEFRVVQLVGQHAKTDKVFHGWTEMYVKGFSYFQTYFFQV